MTLELQEVDSTGNVVTTYLSSEDRLDVTRPESKHYSITNIWQSALTVFLPVGYPNSVTPDYLRYQIYDSLQAFSSSIAGLLSSRAVLEGVGVGDASASPTAAIILNIIQESTGRIATIVFAHRLGSALEPECKMWRLAADIFNDAAMILDCLSPALPKTPRVLLLSTSSTLRALCGVAAGSSKASLSAHFAKWGNLGELNAKDSSQETVISLIGMLVGSAVVGYITSATATWSCLVLLLSIHLAMNHAAVRAVSMHTLNRQRANLVFSHIFENQIGGYNKVIPTPEEVSAQEYIFEKDGVLRWGGDKVLGWAKIGARFEELVSLIGPQNKSTASVRTESVKISTLIDIFKGESYILWYSPIHKQAIIVLRADVTAREQLKAWAHALLVAREIGKEKEISASDKVRQTVESALKFINADWVQIQETLSQAGWDIDAASLETTSGARLRDQSLVTTGEVAKKK